MDQHANTAEKGINVKTVAEPPYASMAREGIDAKTVAGALYVNTVD